MQILTCFKNSELQNMVRDTSFEGRQHHEILPDRGKLDYQAEAGVHSEMMNNDCYHLHHGSWSPHSGY